MTAGRHGDPATYRHGRCRCKSCRQAHNAEEKRGRAARHARLLADPTIVEHGKLSTYSNWMCRCVPCGSAVKANRKRRRDERRQRRSVAGTDDPRGDRIG